MINDVFGDATRGEHGPQSGSRSTARRSSLPMRRASSGRSTGLTLVEAAAVGGDPLAVEALASALGTAFTATPRPGRVAVAMSGAVDSAVALVRAGPNAIGVTLRLWQDPAAPDTERACCSPAAVAAARAACHERGLPHVTLDLREEFKHAIVDPFTRAYEAGETPNPCMRCNGAFRFDELVAFARRAGADELWTGHYARIVERDGLRLVARAADEHKDQSYMLAAVDPALLEHVRFPLGEQTKAETRVEALDGRVGCGGSAREPGGVLPGWRRLPRVPRAPGPARERGSDRRRGRRPAGSPRRSLEVHARPAARAWASPERGRSTSCARTRRRTP